MARSRSGSSPPASWSTRSLPVASTVDETRHVVLIGMMAVGKTTVGRLVATHLERPYIDLDQLIVERDGRPIPEIFREDGESGFRAREHDALREALSSSTPIVLSLGGGAVLASGNRALLADHSFVVWLRAEPSTLIERIGDPATRPLLAVDPIGTLERLDVERRDIYAAAAHYAISVDGRTPRWVSSVIARRVKGQRGRTA
jgi:shikimate kinase